MLIGKTDYQAFLMKQQQQKNIRRTEHTKQLVEGGRGSKKNCPSILNFISRKRNPCRHARHRNKKSLNNWFMYKAYNPHLEKSNKSQRVPVSLQEVCGTL